MSSNINIRPLKKKKKKMVKPPGHQLVFALPGNIPERRTATDETLEKSPAPTKSFPARSFKLKRLKRLALHPRERNESLTQLSCDKPESTSEDAAFPLKSSSPRLVILSTWQAAAKETGASKEEGSEIVCLDGAFPKSRSRLHTRIPSVEDSTAGLAGDFSSSSIVLPRGPQGPLSSSGIGVALNLGLDDSYPEDRPRPKTSDNKSSLPRHRSPSPMAFNTIRRPVTAAATAVTRSRNGTERITPRNQPFTANSFAKFHISHLSIIDKKTRLVDELLGDASPLLASSEPPLSLESDIPADNHAGSVAPVATSYEEVSGDETSSGLHTSHPPSTASPSPSPESPTGAFYEEDHEKKLHHFTASTVDTSAASLTVDALSHRAISTPPISPISKIPPPIKQGAVKLGAGEVLGRVISPVVDRSTTMMEMDQTPASLASSNLLHQLNHWHGPFAIVHPAHRTGFMNDDSLTSIQPHGLSQLKPLLQAASKKKSNAIVEIRFMWHDHLREDAMIRYSPTSSPPVSGESAGQSVLDHLAQCIADAWRHVNADLSESAFLPSSWHIDQLDADGLWSCLEAEEDVIDVLNGRRSHAISMRLRLHPSSGQAGAKVMEERIGLAVSHLLASESPSLSLKLETSRLTNLETETSLASRDLAALPFSAPARPVEVISLAPRASTDASSDRALFPLNNVSRKRPSHRFGLGGLTNAAISEKSRRQRQQQKSRISPSELGKIDLRLQLASLRYPARPESKERVTFVSETEVEREIDAVLRSSTGNAQRSKALQSFNGRPSTPALSGSKSPSMASTFGESYASGSSSMLEPRVYKRAAHTSPSWPGWPMEIDASLADTDLHETFAAYTSLSDVTATQRLSLAQAERLQTYKLKVDL